MRMVALLCLPLTLLACSQKPPAPAGGDGLAPVAGENWTIDPAASHLRFSGIHAGKPFAGEFQRFSASIRFDPADPANAAAVVLVETESARTGDAFRDTNARTEDWFDVKAHPTARFESTSVRDLGGGSFELLGDLEIKGAKTPVVLPFTVTRDASRASAKGGADLDRFTLGLGRTSDPKEEWVARTIRFEFDLQAEAKTGP